MEVINILLAVGTIIAGLIFVRVMDRYINRLKETKAFKQLIKHSDYNTAIIWYIFYFIKLAIYIIISLIAISFLGFAQQVLALVAVIMTLSIIGVLVYSLRDLIPSAFAGAYLMHGKIIKKGDVINVRGFQGRVKEITLLTITVIDDKGGVIMIPNKIIMEKILKKK